eukprot:COSAG06_NODE_29480_length_555_cov_1.899123_1_plen_29_part_10
MRIASAADRVAVLCWPYLCVSVIAQLNQA